MSATLRVVEVFQSLQGEGIWAGTPMTFVRMAGCNAAARRLSCVRWCDTAAAQDPDAGVTMPVGDIAAAVGLPRACLTGGEPLLQAAGVARLASLLRDQGRKVHLETNGTLPLPEAPFDWVTVSPKPPGYVVAEGLADRADEIKVVVDAALSVEAAEELAARVPGAVFSVQPEWSAGTSSVRRAVDLVLSHPKWRLSLQLHKVLDIP